MDEQTLPLDRRTVKAPPSRRAAPGAIRIPIAAAVAVILILLVAGSVFLKQDLVVRNLFGPPAVGGTESYMNRPEGPAFDHASFNLILKKYVSAEGWVDYQGLSHDDEPLDTYIASIANAPVEQLGRNQRLALLINAYNAFTLRLILDHYPVKSIKDIPGHKRWDDRRWQIGPLTLSLNDIEHEQIRPHFKEPRIHFALVCAAVGCPPLYNAAYTADQLEAQLDRQARIVHDNARWFRFSPDDPTVLHLTNLYNWYGDDFEQSAGSVLDFAARYSTALQQALTVDTKPKIRWLKYDWSLNSRDNAP